MNYRKILFLIFALLSFTALQAQTQSGKASFYAKKFHGRRTASGERLHKDSMTCAHRYYPFGTILRVTNLKNGKQVDVRVTDRGPFVKGRIIDLSWGAANAIGMIAQGVASVKVEVVGRRAKVPYRPDETTEFPEIDFEFAQASYSLADEWKEEQTEISAAPEPQKNQKEKAPKELPEEAKTAAKQSTQPTTTQPEKKKNKWSDVFDKLKHLGR